MKRMVYNSDLTDIQWESIKNLIPIASNIKISRRLLANAVFYLTKNGCQLHQLPKDFPNWKAIYSFFMRCKKKNICEQVMDKLEPLINSTKS